MQCEKEIQLKKIQEIKNRELGNWKKRRQCDIQEEYGNCLTNFGAAHIAACEASCEEDEALQNKREEYDLLAAQRGRSAMLQEQRKRDREAEERLAKRRRRQLKNAAVQANLVTRRDVATNVEESDEYVSEEEENSGVRVETFTNKPNLHKSSASSYNPKNFTSNSVDSSNNCDSEEEDETSSETPSEDEFNQITNLLKQKCFEPYHEPPAEEVVEVSSSSEEEPIPVLKGKPKLQPSPKKKGILKKVQTPKGKKLPAKPVPAKKAQPVDQRVKYVDFSNKYVTSYAPADDLVTHNSDTSKRNANSEAKKLEQSTKRKVDDDVLK